MLLPCDSGGIFPGCFGKHLASRKRSFAQRGATANALPDFRWMTPKNIIPQKSLPAFRKTHCMPP